MSTHVLDISLGRPAAGVPVSLAFQTSDGAWKEIARGTTDTDGRISQLLPQGATLLAGNYRMRFGTAAYFGSRGVSAFYPEVIVVFAVQDASHSYHIPLLLAPYGYSTYLGS